MEHNHANGSSGHSPRRSGDHGHVEHGNAPESDHAHAGADDHDHGHGMTAIATTTTIMTASTTTHPAIPTGTRMR